AVAGDGVDVPGGHRLAVEGAGAFGDDTQTLVAGVSDDDVARAVHTHAIGEVQRCLGRRPPVAGVPRCPVASHGVDVTSGHSDAVESAGPVGRHTDRRVVGLGDDIVTVAVHRHRGGVPHLGLGGRPPVPRVPREAVTGDGVDVPGVHRDAVEGTGGRGDN